ncbi:DHA2 family efflux MFS transporter permease subunit [Actinomadura sp. 9N215]|uniref:DHA2 family efflux MFS transporter permease subunit n=1 Tax=Actinomadura sp. 9N215 TaxID=3375150 RepID=UPI0037A1A9BD
MGTSFSPQLRRVLLVTTLGSFLAFLDSTIVNVALQSLATSTGSPLSTIQWLVTAYLLAVAAVLPVSGWAAGRFGARPVYILGIAAFGLGSLACGLAGSVGQLIAFRVVQGIAAALASTAAQILAVRAAGPERLARVMSVTGVPTILAPIIGPTIGGLLLQHAGWRWIFLINLPLCALIVALAPRMLPPDPARQPGRLDLPGVITLALGCVGLTYGLTELGEHRDIASAAVLGPVTAGLALLAGFVVHALRTPAPLLDLRLHRNARFAAASMANFFLGAVIFGAIILMPLYFQIVRHEDTVTTGLLLIPQGIGIAVAIGGGDKLIKALGTGRTALLGGLISVVATVPFVFVTAGTSYWELGAAMTVRGLGVGATVVPIMTAAYRAVPAAAISDATVQLNVIQRIGGSISTALFAVVLQGRLDGATTPAAQASGFGTAFWWVLAIGLCATAPTLLLVVAERRPPPARDTSAADVSSAV